MSRLHQHSENHLVDRIGWLRAAVLGANDGIIATGSLVVGVAAAAVSRHALKDGPNSGVYQICLSTTRRSGST